MDAAEEIPHLVRPEKKPHFDGEAPPHSPTQAAAVAKVLNDDDLLREIIVRVGLPTTLVCAALVCKRWLAHASDPKFLSRFRKLHPPRLHPPLYVMGDSTKEAEKSTVRVYMLQDGVWRVHMLATCCHGLVRFPKAMLVGNKICMLAASGDDIDVLDLMASTISTIQLPEGVKCNDFNSWLSRADDPSSICLIHVEEFQLRVWHHKGANWFLVDTICLHKMLAILGMSYAPIGDQYVPNVQINLVGENGQSVILWMGQCLINLDIKCRTPCKVYENKGSNHYFPSVHPLMMIWPPTFPALKDDPARKLLAGQ